MKRLRWFVPILLIMVPFYWAAATTLRVAQIDNTSLLINQRIGVYVSITGDEGKPVKGLQKEDFALFETADEKRLSREIIELREGANVTQGVTFLLVIDNSGSMYWNADGRIKDSEDPKLWRISSAKRAVSDLLKEIRNPKDRIGLVSFNMRIDSTVLPTDDKVAVERALLGIERPAEEEAFTELYETLYHSIEEMSGYGGRKVIIVLSDGVDFPMEDNPHFPVRYGIDGVIESAQREGISIFTIGLSKKADNNNLALIAGATGGAHFSTYSPEEIARLYSLIRDQILNEYLLIYAAGMSPAERKLVSVEYQPAGGERLLRSERYYFSDSLFGVPQSAYQWLAFTVVPVVAVLLWILSLMGLEGKREAPMLDVYQGKGRGKRVQTVVMPAKKKSVTIGADTADDVTISGDRKVAKTMVQIEQKDGVYRVASKGGTVVVNNRQVRTKALRSGDVITVGDTTVVFDEGTKKK
jgi:Ca-activated chloride channel family protein